MSTISQGAVYQLCETFENNYSYILKIVKDVYPELYSNSPTHDWQRKSILVYFHKNFEKLLKKSKRVEEEKLKPFQWSDWKKTAENDVIIIDLTLQNPTNWNIYKMYVKNGGNSVDVLDMIRKDFPNFTIPDKCADDVDLCHEICKKCEKVQTILDSGCEEKLKQEKETLFTWESEKLRFSQNYSPSINSFIKYPTNWDIYKLCKQMKFSQNVVFYLKRNYPDLYIPAGFELQQLKMRVCNIFKKASLLYKSNQLNELTKEKETLFTWCEENLIPKKTADISVNSSIDYPTNWDVYQLYLKKKFYRNVVYILKKKYSDLHIPAEFGMNELQSRIIKISRKITLLIKSNQLKELAKEKKTLFTWYDEDPSCKQTTQLSEEFDLNQTKYSVKDKVDENCRESPTDCLPFPPSLASPPASPHHNNSCISLRVPQIQTSTSTPLPHVQPPIEFPTNSGTAGNSSLLSPIETHGTLSEDSEREKLILAIKKFENLISEAMKQIVAKDSKIENLKKKIKNVRSNQKKICYNLKRLRFQHLRQKIDA